MSPDDPRHGQRRGYYAHRQAGQPACLDCKRAAAAAEARYALNRMYGKPGRVPAIGTQRRLRALQALGWTFTEIAAQLNTKRSRVEKWSNQERRYVYASTAAKVAQVYDRLNMVVPTGRWATRTRNTARARGYAPPMCWEPDTIDDPNAEPNWGGDDHDIDPVVVMRLLEGQRVQATKAEKEAAMAQWVADGGSRNELARIHGWKPERYTRHLRVVGEAS